MGLRGRLGIVDGLGEKVTQSNRFFIGGRSVRGFAGGGIGPRDAGTLAAVGGNNMYTGSVELISSYGFSKDLGIRWTVYSDVGSTWGTDYVTGVLGANNDTMRQSVGFGLLWDTGYRPVKFLLGGCCYKGKFRQDKALSVQYRHTLLA